jgi:hypothetical protein
LRQQRPLVVVPSFDLDAISQRVQQPLGVGSCCVITLTSFREFNEGAEISG